jgi:hypothetical protein
MVLIVKPLRADVTQERLYEWRAIDNSQPFAAKRRKLARSLVVHEHNARHIQQNYFLFPVLITTARLF